MMFSKTARALLAVLAIGTFVLGFRLGDRSFRNPDEGRYAEIARTMAESGDWLEPTLYGVDYLSKPPLFYWLVSGSFKVFGYTEFAARLVPAAFALLGVAAAFAFAVRVFEPRAAFFGSLVLATNVWYVQVGRYLLIDAVFTFFVSAALFAFYLGVRERRPVFYHAGYVFVALSFLTKGVAGPVLVGVAALVYLAASRHSFGGAARAFFEAKLPAGALIFSALVLPWFVAISLREPEFLRRFFVHEHFKRFISPEFEHQESWYYYAAIMAAVLMPWTLFAGQIARSFSAGDAARRDAKLFLLAAAVAPVFFYSLSKTKLPTYILPSLPFCALLIGEGWAEVREDSAISRQGSFFLTALLCAAALVFVPFAPELLARFARRMQPSILPYARAFALVGAAGTAVTLFFMARRRASRVFFTFIATLIGISTAVAFAMERSNTDYTTRPFAEVLRPKLAPGDLVFIYDQPGAFYDFRFYLKHPVKLAGLEGELKLAERDHEEIARASVSFEEFRRMIEKDANFYCLMRRSDFDGFDENLRTRLRVVMQDGRKVLLANGGGIAMIPPWTISSEAAG